LQHARRHDEGLDRAAPRAIALLVVAGAHLAVIALLVASTQRAGRIAPVEPTVSTLVTLLPDRAAKTPRPTAPDTSDVEPVRVLPAPEQRAAPPLQPPVGSTVPSPPVDWQKEAELAARRFVAAEETRQRQLDALAQPVPGQAQEDKGRAKPFRWSNTRRIQVDKGIPVVLLNEHCLLVAFVIPACAVGRIEARGDLFENMEGPAEPGDWKLTE
jgi:hypothetical protein